MEEDEKEKDDEEMEYDSGEGKGIETNGRATTANSSFANKLNRKTKEGQGLYRVFGQSQGQTNKQTAKDAAGPGPETKTGLKRSHYNYETYVHVEMNLHGGDDGVKITTEVVGKLRAVMKQIGEEILDCGILPLKKLSKEVVWKRETNIRLR